MCVCVCVCVRVSVCVFMNGCLIVCTAVHVYSNHDVKNTQTRLNTSKRIQRRKKTLITMTTKVRQMSPKSYADTARAPARRLLD